MDALKAALARKRRTRKTARIIADPSARETINALDHQIRNLEHELNRLDVSAGDLAESSPAAKLPDLYAQREALRDTLDTISITFQSVGRGFMREVEQRYPPTAEDIAEAKELGQELPQFSTTSEDPAKERYGAMAELLAKACVKVDDEEQTIPTTPDALKAAAKVWHELLAEWSTGEIQYLWGTFLACEGEMSQVPFSAADIEKMRALLSSSTSASEMDVPSAPPSLLPGTNMTETPQ